MSAALVAPRPPSEARHAAIDQIAGGLERMGQGIRNLAELLERQADQAPSRAPMHTVEDAAKILKCSGDHVRARVRSGAIKAFRDGKLWRIADEDLEAYRRRRTR